MKFGVLGILCRFFIAYFIAHHLNVNFSILIFWIREESLDFATDYGLAIIMWFLFGRVSSLGARAGCIILLWPSLGCSYLINY